MPGKARRLQREMSRSRQVLNRGRLEIAQPKPATGVERGDALAPFLVHRITRARGLDSRMFIAGARSLARAREIAQADHFRCLVTQFDETLGSIEHFDNGKAVLGE